LKLRGEFRSLALRLDLTPYGCSRLLSPAAFLATAVRCTQAVKLQFMALYFEPLFPCHIVLERYDAFILKFDDRAAFSADPVTVMGVCVPIFKADEAILKPTFLGGPTPASSFNVRYIVA
jgi:hypothetical protein